MNQLRATLVLSYATIGAFILGLAVGISRRSADSIWATTLRDVRGSYDVLAITMIALSLAVAVGLLLRKEWGRVFSISLSFIVFFTYVGMPIFATLDTDLGFGSFLRPESYAIGSLAIVNAIALSHRRFRAYYASPGVTSRASQGGSVQ